MKRITVPTLLVFTLALAGCGQDTDTALAPAGGSPSAGPEQQTLEQNVAESPEVFEDGSYELPGDEETTYAALGAEASGYGTAQDPSPDHKLPRWFRDIRERRRSVVVRIEEGETYFRAHAHVTVKFAGVLNILFPAPDATTDTRELQLVQKRFQDVANRYAVYFKRKPTAEGDVASSDASLPGDALSDAERAESEELAAHRSGWHLAGISNVRASSPDHTANILKIWLLTESGAKYEIDDPMALMRFPRGVPGVHPGEVVKVVVKVRDPEDLLFLFTRWGRQVMIPVEAMPDMDIAADAGLFAGRFRAPEDRHLFHVGVNALDRATLLTKDGRYDSDFWGLLLRNQRPEVALAD